MDYIQTIIIAIVEGLTEFLPVSSTGHMIITQNLLGVQQGDPFVHAFTFIIQFGAILSVVCLYRKRFFSIDHSPVPEFAEMDLWQKTQHSFMENIWQSTKRGFYWLRHRLSFYWLLAVGVLPAVVVGLAAKKSGLLDWLLDSVEVVAVTLVLGGVFMLFCDRIFNKGVDENGVDWKRAFKIGCFQCLSVIPGMSRSMSTIVGGMQQKLTRKQAAEFSFFLAVPTMAGATLLDLIEMFGEEATWATTRNIEQLALGSVIAFIVAIVAMKWFVGFLAKYGFKAFGWYRIIVGLIILIMLATGHSLAMVD
ncbi:undecaprenyl-diphosphate phosphatase [Prevotella sp. A2931]|uniref:Undecaprenyl-diphosphatase n=1 Tax=Prevotella illustrans TaxID=2800387 RepID=A0ABS3M7Z8_9BACT|nr:MULTISPECIES: undecaprenyl-diphosphate phosphatase [Prevotella]MBO1364313.1 undecaprenyl-diphosphate phosphatase [Prevotella illustrans]PTL26170.1 undecaprenyl-diphosphate phosphatase [Prevotella sp. oral taxon 820]